MPSNVEEPEWEAFAAGLKPAIRVTVEPVNLEASLARLRAVGARAVSAGAVLGGREIVVLYVAREMRRAEALRDAEAPVLPGGAPLDPPEAAVHHMTVGRLLGFPRCCVEAYCARLVRGVDTLPGVGAPRGLHEDYAAAREAFAPRADARLNNLLFASRARLVSFYPCRYDCDLARRYGDAVLRAVARRDPAAATALLASLARPVAIAPTGARAVALLYKSEGGPTRILSAAAPRGRGDGDPDVRDEMFARSLAGATVASSGEITGAARPHSPPAWLVPFTA